MMKDYGWFRLVIWLLIALLLIGALLILIVNGNKGGNIMNIGAWIRLVVWGVIALLLIGILGVLLLHHDRLPTVDTSNWSFGITAHTYRNAEQYTVGSTEMTEPIREIDIRWISGEVEIVAVEGDTLRLTEHEPPQDESFQMHWLVKNGTLYIKFCKSKLFMGFTNWGDKRLTLEVPSSWMDSINGIRVETTSASIDVRDVKARSIELDAVSGAIRAQNVTASTLELDTVSGAIEVDGLEGKRITAETTSGTVRLVGAMEHVETDSVSGRVTVDSQVTPRSFEADTVSGSVTLICPEGNGFTLELETVSGGFDCDYPINKSGKLHICGDGESNFEINTVSGDAVIRKP